MEILDNQYHYSELPELVAAFQDDLERLASSQYLWEGADELDEIAQDVLDQYGWV